MTAQLALVAVCALCAGCFGGDSLNCEDPALYGSSFSVPPVRVPEGLDVPDESDALQIPSGEPFVVRDIDTMTECLEAPPDYFEDEDSDG